MKSLLILLTFILATLSGCVSEGESTTEQLPVTGEPFNCDVPVPEIHVIYDHTKHGGNYSAPEQNITEEDVDGDGIHNDCDPDDNDGPLGDTDYDWINNANDVCKGYQDRHDVNDNQVSDGCDPLFASIPWGGPLDAVQIPQGCFSWDFTDASLKIGINPAPVKSNAFCAQTDADNATWTTVIDQFDTPAPFCIHHEEKNGTENQPGDAKKYRFGILIGGSSNSGGFCRESDDTSNATYIPWTPNGNRYSAPCIALYHINFYYWGIGVGYVTHGRTHCDSRDDVMWINDLILPSGQQDAMTAPATPEDIRVQDALLG